MNKRFESDEAKRCSNLRKHSIDFADCPPMLRGETVDTCFDYGEQRFVTLGLLNGRVIAVAHTETANTIRFISARKATRHEQRIH